MKHISKTIIAILLALIMGLIIPTQVFANIPDYISEIKIAMGSTVAKAEKDLNGYTILKCDNKTVDLNYKAGSDERGSKGDKVVLLGYKTTKNRKEAITDLALMNMKGGFSVEDYEMLMETQLKTQIIPFIERFQAAIDEYRENYNSKIKANKQRAQYLHDVLNKLTDDDTGKPLGDLFLNETKFEMGDEAYNKLSDEEKKNHADILTIFAQANSKATLIIENLLTRAADTEDTTWLERCADTTYEDLIDQTGMSPKQARKEVAKLFDDTANDFLGKWNAFRNELLNYDNALKTVNDYDEKALNEALNAVEGLGDNSSESEVSEALDKAIKANDMFVDYIKAKQIVIIREKLESIPYLDGTMLDYFLREYSDVEDNITLLYPLAASLSEGQKTGVEFVSLREFAMVAIDSEEGYHDETLDEIKEASIYDGVDRGIYQKGGVGLTNDALRQEADKNAFTPVRDSKITDILVYITYGLAGTAIATGITAFKLAHSLADLENSAATMTGVQFNAAYTKLLTSFKVIRGISIGFAIASMIFLFAITFADIEETKAYYNVEFAPIPRYMIDEKDLVAYNSKGEKIILKNQTAYYKAVECNRTESSEMWNSVGNCADMNGDVGSQWLALYAAKNENEEPILADSLKVVLSDDKVPADYTTGIHMFGSEAAFNLNAYPYSWNEKARSTYIYFNRDDGTNNGSAAASVFSGGSLFAAAGSGLILGALITLFATKIIKKEKDSSATIG